MATQCHPHRKLIVGDIDCPEGQLLLINTRLISRRIRGWSNNGRNMGKNIESTIHESYSKVLHALRTSLSRSMPRNRDAREWKIHRNR